MNDNPLLSAVDNHNVANGDDSWFSTRVNDTGDFIDSVGEAVTKGSIGAVVAGVDSLINTGVAVANFLGADLEPTSTYENLKAIDDDLGLYYRQHEAGVETAGFVVTSLVPGTAGIKAINAAKAGVLGTNMAKASGLMRSVTADYAKVARIEFAMGETPFSILNANTVKALAQGVGSSAIDMAAFEAATYATMYKSPLLDGQGASDIFWNMTTGTLIGGGLGGIFHGASLAHGIFKAGKQADIELFPYKNIEMLPELATPDLKLINLFHQKFNMPEAELLEDAKSELDPAARLKLINSARTKTLDKIDVLIREQVTDIAGGDPRLSAQMYDTLQRAQSFQDVTGALMHVRALKRITQAETLEYGDVIFPQDSMQRSIYDGIVANGSYDKLFVNSATANTQGYLVAGDISKLKVTSYTGVLGNKEVAFAAKYDMFRNPNGTFSVNPESTILKQSDLVRTKNNRIVDFEQDGTVVSKATPGLADIATKDNPIEVRGDTILAGKINPIKVKDSLRYSPLEGTQFDAQARYIWAQEQKNIPWKNKVVGENDLPMLERAYYAAERSHGMIIKFADGKTSLAPTGEALGRFIEQKKTELAQLMNGKPLDEIGLRLNVSDNWLKGEKDDLARIRPGVDYQNPRYGRVDYSPDVNAMETYNANQIDGFINYQLQKGIIEQRHIQNFANYARELTPDFLDAPNWNDPGRTPTRGGAGAALAGFANANYGSAGAWAQYTGTQVNKLKIAKKTNTAQLLNLAISKVSQAGPDAIAEFALIQNKLRSSPEAWVFHPSKENVLIPRKDFTNVLQKKGDPSEEIRINSVGVVDLLKAHTDINNERQAHVANLKGTAGVFDNSDSAVVYPIPIDTTKYKHFVIVEPKGFNLPDKKRIIAAKDELTLSKLADQVDRSQFTVTTKQQAEDWHKALGDYDFSLGINESSVDSTLNRKGVLSEFFPTTSGDRVLQDLLDWHMKQEDILATRMIDHRYSQTFQELENLGKQYTNLATSQFRSLTQKLQSGVKDPYLEVIKTALDISTGTESRYNWWRGFNDTIKDAIEKPVNKMREIFNTAPEMNDETLAKINAISERMGMGKPYETAFAANVANGNIIAKPWLARGIAKANGIMSSTLLQLDFFNAINNAISTPIITSAEISNLTKAIMHGDETVAGKLARLMSVESPKKDRCLII